MGKVTETEIAFINRVSKALEILDADSGIRSIVGSYKDTLEDDEVMGMFDAWIEQATEEKNIGRQFVPRYDLRCYYAAFNGATWEVLSVTRTLDNDAFIAALHDAGNCYDHAGFVKTLVEYRNRVTTKQGE